jgi:peptidoglycan/LPS O-acetylase OafA/YrhL
VPFRLGHRPALDGVRGLAILTVMVVHTGAESFAGGFLSVDVFFVLSGFLITSVLLQEWDGRGTIRLKNFYARRALRLLPALFVLLLALAWLSLNMPFFPEAALQIRREIVYTFFYVTNWAIAFGAMSPLGILGHAWTLAIEEQFYFVWPVMLLTLLRAGFSRRAVAWAIVAAIVASARLRLVLYELGAGADRLFFGFDTRCDTLLAGCLAGVCATFLDEMSDRTRLAVRWAARAGVTTLALLFLTISHDDPFLFRGGFTLIAASAAVTLLAVVDNPGGLIARALAWRPLVHAGDVSYGLYLWHWPVFLYLMPSVVGLPPLATNLVRFAATFVMAELSARLIERPFLRQKTRWT